MNTPLRIRVLLLAAIACATFSTAAHAQRVETVFGVAKVTLPKGAKIELVDGYDGTKMYAVYFPGSTPDQTVMIAKKTLSKSESRWTNDEWAKRRINYYKNLFKSDRNYKSNSLKGNGKGRQVVVDYGSGFGNLKYRDFTKYIRANKTTQVQAWYSTDKVSRWNQSQPLKLRAVVSSLRPVR